MKILVVSQWYYPEEFRINEICETLVKMGNEVTVLTGLPNYPNKDIPKEYSSGKRSKEKINGVNVIRTYEFARKNGTLRLIFNYLSFAISASLKVFKLEQDFDIVYVYEISPITMGIPAIIYKKLNKVPLHLYCCDLWPESISGVIKNKKNIIYKFVTRMSKWIYSNCDQITVTSKPFIKYLIDNHGIEKNKIFYLPQHAEDIKVNRRVVNRDCIEFIFMGNIGTAQDIECILKASEILKNKGKRFKVNFVGDGSFLEKSKEIVKKSNLENYIIFHGRHAQSEMSKFYENSDVCLLTLKGDSFVGMTIPGKLQGYMSAGKMVLGAINGAAQEIIKEAQCGISVPASDFNSLVIAMEEIINNPEICEEYGKNSRKYYDQNFTKDIFIERLINKFEIFLKESKNV